VGGGFYEPILAAIPPQDAQEQITRLADYIERHFGTRPRGAWIAERVWEPQLASILARAGVRYTLVDDNHFLGAGFELGQLYGHYICEDLGHPIHVLPGLKTLRYLIPFHSVGETTDFLRESAAAHPTGFATMGDDLEKFGVWPGTHQHCYGDGWLEHFFSALDASSDWLAMSTPGEAIDAHASLGRAELPTASYTEMMEWSLPTTARDRYHQLTSEFSSRPESLAFLRGGTWKNFFTKYAEANLLHKKMLHASRRVNQLRRSRRRDKVFLEARAEAATALLRGQCNDAYWHGVFGGLYSPHLRTAVWHSLARAEAVADGAAHRKRAYAEAEQLDFDADGREEIYLTSDRYAALIDPDDGGTVSALDVRPRNVTLINSLARGPESYHAKLRKLPAEQAQGVRSIHEQVRVKEEGLERWLHYDRWPRNSFRLLVFGRERNYQDCGTAGLEEDAVLAAGRYQVTEISPACVKLSSSEGGDWRAQKTLSFFSTRAGFDVVCDVSVQRTSLGTSGVNIGIEVVVNFLAPSAPDRYFESGGQRFPLRWAAAVPGPDLRVTDEWQRARVTLAAPEAQQFWVAPIDTVSESESGFERVYQGSQVVAVWPADLAQGAEWKGQLVFKVAQLD